MVIILTSCEDVHGLMKLLMNDSFMNGNETPQKFNATHFCLSSHKAMGKCFFFGFSIVPYIYINILTVLEKWKLKVNLSDRKKEHS